MRVYVYVCEWGGVTIKSLGIESYHLGPKTLGINHVLLLSTGEPSAYLYFGDKRSSLTGSYYEGAAYPNWDTDRCVIPACYTPMCFP